MRKRRKAALAIVLAVVLAAHIALFAADGSWRTLGKVLIVVDVVSIWFVMGAIREFKKLDEKGN
jgi:hypothetical protein